MALCADMLDSDQNHVTGLFWHRSGLLLRGFPVAFSNKTLGKMRL